MKKAKQAVGNFTGMPAGILLEEFGSVIWAAFGHPPYLVGSATFYKSWRDVDVRLILDDKEYAKWFGKELEQGWNQKRRMMELAFSVLGKQMTGLPIDFQIQQQTDANKKFGRQKHARMAIGCMAIGRRA